MVIITIAPADGQTFEIEATDHELMGGDMGMNTYLQLAQPGPGPYKVTLKSGAPNPDNTILEGIPGDAWIVYTGYNAGFPSAIIVKSNE